MSFKNYDEQSSNNNYRELPLGWHTLQIIEADVNVYGGNRSVSCIVKCVSPSAPGTELGMRMPDSNTLLGAKTYDNRIQNGLTIDFRSPRYNNFVAACSCHPHDPDVMTGDELVACYLGRIFRAELNKETTGYPALSNLRRPTLEQREECADYMDLELLRENDEKAQAYSALSEFRDCLPAIKIVFDAIQQAKKLIAEWNLNPNNEDDVEKNKDETKKMKVISRRAVHQIIHSVDGCYGDAGGVKRIH